MDTEKALSLTSPDKLLKAAKEAEARNCDLDIVRKLWSLYFKYSAGRRA